MADPKIMVQFRKGMAGGFSKQHIRNSLIEKGYNPAEVNIVMQMMEQEQQEKMPKQVPAKQADVFSVVLVIGLIIVGGLLYYGYHSEKQGAEEVEQQKSAIQSTVKPEELDLIGEVLSSLDAAQPQKQALLRSTETILKTNVSKEDMMAVVKQNNDKLQELQAGEQEDIAKLKYLAGELQK